MHVGGAVRSIRDFLHHDKPVAIEDLLKLDRQFLPLERANRRIHVGQIQRQDGLLASPFLPVAEGAQESAHRLARIGEQGINRRKRLRFVLARFLDRFLQFFDVLFELGAAEPPVPVIVQAKAERHLSVDTERNRYVPTLHLFGHGIEIEGDRVQNLKELVREFSAESFGFLLGDIE